MGFTLCKAEQSLWGMDLQEKEEKKDNKHTGKFIVGREFQNPAVWEKKLSKIKEWWQEYHAVYVNNT